MILTKPPKPLYNAMIVETVRYHRGKFDYAFLGILQPEEIVDPSWTVIDLFTNGKQLCFLTNFQTEDPDAPWDDIARALVTPALNHPDPKDPILARYSKNQVFSVWGVNKGLGWRDASNYRTVGKRKVIFYSSVACDTDFHLPGGVTVRQLLPESIFKVRGYHVQMRHGQKGTMHLDQAELVRFYREYGRVIEVRQD